MPSLRYIFREPIPNLDVIELSEREVSKRWKERYGTEVSEVLKEFVNVEDWIVDHIANSPGVAEEFMIANIVELEDSGNYDHIVWDTAASSSTMHLLLLESEFYEHLDRDVRIYLRLKNRFRMSKTSDILDEWKDLADRVWNRVKESRYHIVTTMDELSLIQTGEIKRDIASMGLEIDSIIYNRCEKVPANREPRSIIIPELKGDSMEIVKSMQKYVSPLFNSARKRRDIQKSLVNYL